MAEENKSKYFQFKLPRITFKDTQINVYLVYTLVIFAFLLGMLTNKVMYLEKNGSNQAPTVAADPNQPPAPAAVVENLEVGKLPLLGKEDAKVTIVEFSDFQCPFCKSYFDQTHKQIVDTYVNTGKVKFAFRHFPLTSIHPLAQKASEASECANEQGKFWEYHDTLFKNQDTWSPMTEADAIKAFTDYAGELDISTTQFNSCLTSDKYKQNVDDATAVGTNDAQVDGTPSFFINGVRVVGAVPFADIQKVIEEELNK